MNKSHLNDDHSDDFVRLLAEHDRDVFLFILALVPNWADAEEIRQETHVKLWREFAGFQPGTDFGKWARTIARYEVLSFRNRRNRNAIGVNLGAIDSLAAEVDDIAEQTKLRQSLMADCVENLSAFRRELVRLHYTLGRKIRDISEELHSTPDAIYKTLQRTRIALRRCIDRKLGEGESV